MGHWRNFLIIFTAFIAVLILINSDSESGRYYDCREAHWHPDYPIGVKEQCLDLYRQERRRLEQEEIDRKTLRT
jgi:hypothetical protein